jgi:hypothetical protein
VKGGHGIPLAPHALAVRVLTTMEQDCGPVCAEPYAGWAKQLAEAYLTLEETRRP